MANCENCKKNAPNGEIRFSTIDMAIEGAIYRVEKTNKRIAIVLVITIMVFFISNVVQFMLWSSFYKDAMDTEQNVYSESLIYNTSEYLALKRNISNEKNLKKHRIRFCKSA